MTRVTVLGAGGWGTAFALVLADAGCDVHVWARRDAVARELHESRTNSVYLPGIELPTGVRATTDAAAALAGADLVVLAVPAQALREHLVRWAPLLPPAAPLVSLAKGVELGTGARMTEVVREVTGAAQERLVAVSGPNLALEVARREPSATVVACTDDTTGHAVADACTTASFRPYLSTDVVGVEVAGAVKNVVALAVGIAEGLGYGDNAKAAVVTRGLAESARLGVALGASSGTFAGLAGAGDLVATCASPLSRNHRAGVALGQGRGVQEVLGAGQVAEGVRSAAAVLGLAHSRGVQMPLTEQVAEVVAGRRSAAEAARALLSRPRTTDGI
ncbi:glycerol-3-phosphate dehydrogenase (NAD(P)+) [Kineococcus xinjiangensis]|uniref:Glycerol-3-phosphate dehydrogenase [NAD(P)+] n=1 Tax=Kineococcus xinjiangensis TaxID=512762 RepID=A0A2S6IW34_9ACTN|nr:NAD(P)H-dependent glycerol-3-phosphate dehydrogenase [Kineococcus xinjiangensis]PPK98558.1 glycerol-3-phosphate dehydrogenase (NAD(P)+) [Kineococcus xinjiangensis]